MRILLVAYFYPPCRDTGAARPASMAQAPARAGPRGHRPHHFGLRRARRRRVAGGAHRRRAALAGAPPRAAAHPGAVRLRHLRRAPARAEQGARSRAARTRLAAVRAPARPRAPATHAVRLRDHDLAARVGPPDRLCASPPRRSLGCRRPRLVDIRAAAPALPDPPATGARRADGATRARRSGRRRLRLAARRRRPANARNRRAARDRQRLGPAGPKRAPRRTSRTPLPGRGEGRSAVELDPDRVSLVYTGRFGSYGRDPSALVEAPRAARPQRSGERCPPGSRHRGTPDARPSRSSSAAM